MPFFLPKRLIEFEYLQSDKKDYEYEEAAKDYQDEIDFAFFVTNFHYTKTDYEALTPKEKAFIYKAWENKLVADTTHIANAVNNAVSNALRKKGKKATPLWKRKQRKHDVQKMRDTYKEVLIAEEKKGKAWVDAIYKANGMERK